MTTSLDRAKELLARLVAFDTTSHKSNLEIVCYIEGYLTRHGIASQLVLNAAGDKASLFATIGPAGVPGIAISGHTDVVPVTGQAWDSDPFTLTEREGRLYGRGACDMKGYLACALALVPDLVRRRLKVPFHLVFSYDEEIGCIGVRPLLAELGVSLPMPRLAIVGEPTGLRVVDAHKGPARWRVDVKGRPTHSSMAHIGVNAIAYAGELIAELARIEAWLKTAPPLAQFEPPYASLQVTLIEGGSATNIIPQDCWFSFEVRSLPGTDVAGIEGRLRAFAERECLPRMRAIAPEASIDITLVNYVPPYQALPASEAVALALRLAGDNQTFAVPYATEAGLFQAAGVPSVVCGPGDIAQAHTPNEWIAIGELERCLAFLSRVADWAETTTT